MADVSQGYFYDTSGNKTSIEFMDSVARDTLATHTNEITGINTNIAEIESGPLTIAEQFAREGYDGRDLLEVFDSEIANGYSNAWEWLADRVSLQTSTGKGYTGLRPFDYIPETIGSDEIPMILGGFDLDAGVGDTEQPDGLFFHMGRTTTENVQWNTSNVNQGNATNAAPWMVCNLKTWIDGTLLPKFPSTMRAHMGNRRELLETRFKSGSTLTDSTSWAWNDLGRLWPLSEVEVYGANRWSGPYSGALDTQWPIFKRAKDRIRRDANGGRRTWWLLSVMAASSTGCCHVSSHGYATYTNASHSGVAVAAGFKVVGE